MRKFLTFVILALGLFACGSHEPFDINEDDAATSADSTPGADTASNRDTSTAPPATCEGRCGSAYDQAKACQCDSACVSNKDCCNDYQSLCKPSGNCVDNDGDGYCDSAPKQGDCNDNNKNINPGAAEVCAPDGTGNGVDENCNGTKDEGCKAAPSNPAPTSGTATVKVTYPTVRFQQLLVHVWGGSKSYIFSGYEKVVNDTEKVFQASVAVDENACGLTIQSANGSSPATSSFWLCTGPGGIGSLDPDAEVEVTYGGKTYYEADMVPLGAPGGGCAIVVPFKKTGACAL